ncbi:hypothetical protein [Deinococcus sp.]|uniref:hypothetical protein n=1 Tax=Deinococcus sp. TaxID=47478 RepID=UPI003B5A3D46
MNRTLALPAVFALTVLLAACGQTPTGPESASLNVDDYIDAQIQGAERAGIRAHMLTLPVEDWQAITYIDFENKHIYTNRVALQGLLSFAESVLGTSNLYTTKSGRQFALPRPDVSAWGLQPQAQGAGSCTATTGPCRRVRTAIGTSSMPYGYGAATVSLLATPVPAGGTPYAYMGATSSTGKESDVGLQYNTGAGDWGAYIRSNNVTVTGDVNNPQPPRRYNPGTSTNFEYLVSNDGFGRLRINKASTSANVPNPFSIDFSQPGLRKDGVGNIVKRITSIASPTTTGGSFAVQWTSMRVGLTTATNHSWGSFASDSSTDNCSTSSRVTYTNVTGGEKVTVQN